MSKFQIKNMSAGELYAWLEELGAYDDVLMDAKGKDLRGAIENCSHPDWIGWLIGEANGDRGFPIWEAYEQATSRAWKAYEQARNQAWEAYIQAVKDLFEVVD